jgi:hypothetical protein
MVRCCRRGAAMVRSTVRCAPSTNPDEHRRRLADITSVRDESSQEDMTTHRPKGIDGVGCPTTGELLAAERQLSPAVRRQLRGGDPRVVAMRADEAEELRDESHEQGCAKGPTA